MIDRNPGHAPLEEQYSAIWSQHGDAPEPSTADFLADRPDASASERLDVLLTDQLLRWQSGRPRPIADYLAEHPSLADDPEATLKLVQGEFLARLDRGETPEPGSYIGMFPDLAEEIRLQCEVDRWLTMAAPPEPLMSMSTTADYGIGHDATDNGSLPASVSQRPADLDAPLVEADFELVRPLGSGGMGEVYEAVQKSLRKRVALKMIRREALDSPSRVRRFFAEARALARLRHPHIVGVHGIGRMADGRYFLVMDLVEDGTTLAALIQQGTVSLDRAAGLVATVAEAIDHAHSRGVVHRDLKPSNVLLDADGQPHVTDFGLAKVFDAVDPDHPPTTADQILGTPHYMTPEQADRTRGPITPRTDVYALGGLLYTLLTGRPPIQGDSLTAILTQVVSPEPVPTPRELRGDVPPGLELICGTCLEKDTQKRYLSAGTVAAVLRAWLANPEVEDSTGVAADSRARTTGSSNDQVTGRSASGWASDRSLKDGGRTPNPGRWAPKAARSAGSRRRIWAAGAVASVLTLLFMALTLVHTQDDHRSRKEARIAVPVSSKPGSELDERAVEVDLLGQSVSIRGNGAETVGGIEGAVDRIAVEIIRHLEQGPTLVVWAFDASGSLLAERQRLAKHIETVYTHIKQLDENSLAADSGLMTMVVAFGLDRKPMLKKPTGELSEIVAAIHDVPLDKTGVENTFTTVGEIAAKWGRYKGAQNRWYDAMIIIVTDEKGDDEARLEDAIAVCRRTEVPAYVLGSYAIFGRPKNYVTYVNPETKQIHYGLEVDQGPESILPEQIHLPFWYGEPQYQILESGFGPYALSRLAAETGGIYFVTRFDTRSVGFDPAQMREYRPDWIPRERYLKQIERSPLRQAVLNAAQITQQRLPGMPSLFFPPADVPEFKDAMANNQAIAERTAYTVDEALTPINAVAKLRDREPSRRWQAHYDLIRGRLLAMKVRCYEYNWACTA